VVRCGVSVYGRDENGLTKVGEEFEAAYKRAFNCGDAPK
jgi:hypothetical protein